MTGTARSGTMSDAGMTAAPDDSQTETDDSAAGEAPERLPYEITDRVSVPEGGGVERDDSYEPSGNDDAAKASACWTTWLRRPSASSLKTSASVS